MNGVLGHNSALGLGTTWAKEMNFVMKHAPGAGSIALIQNSSMSNNEMLCFSASLFYIMKGPEKRSLNTQLRREVVRAILLAMRLHSTEATVLYLIVLQCNVITVVQCKCVVHLGSESI